MVAYWHHQRHPALPMIDGGQQHHCGLMPDWGGENLLVREYQCAMMVARELNCDGSMLLGRDAV